MADPYPIIIVPDDACHAPESLGSKPKFWYYDENDRKVLFKESRENTGEDWAEKVAAELAELLNLPHATVELAEWMGKRGTVSPSFVPENGQLVHGNEIMARVFADYPRPAELTGQHVRVPQHVLSAIFDAIDLVGIVRPPMETPSSHPCQYPSDFFTGYLLLDAWIGNTDRHHHNWGWILSEIDIGAGRTHFSPALAPTFDHAASLGRNESDEKRLVRLKGDDPRITIRAYSEKCRSAIYASTGDAKPCQTFDVFALAARSRPNAARHWIDRLSTSPSEDVESIFARVPPTRITEPATKFAIAMLEYNRTRILDLGETLS